MECCRLLQLTTLHRCSPPPPSLQDKGKAVDEELEDQEMTVTIEDLRSLFAEVPSADDPPEDLDESMEGEEPVDQEPLGGEPVVQELEPHEQVDQEPIPQEPISQEPENRDPVDEEPMDEEQVFEEAAHPEEGESEATVADGGLGSE